MRLGDLDALKEEVGSWGMNDYEPSDFIDAIDAAPTVENIVIFCENADEKTVEELKAELEQVLEQVRRPEGECKTCRHCDPEMEFAKWVTKMIFDNGVEDFDFELFSELACRKLEKLGLVKKTESEWIILRGEEE